MNEAEERKAYDDWLHQSPEFADAIISAWDVWLGRAALAQPEPAAPTEPAPGWCKHCQQYTIDEPLLAAPTAVEPDLFTTDIVPRPLKYPLSDYHKAMSEGPLHYTWQDKPHRLVYDLIAAVRYYATPPRTALTVDQAIYALSSALAESKGWLRDYSDAVIRDAIDRTDAWNRRAAQ